MDSTGIIVAAILLAILLAWYALLEYDERQGRKEAERRPPPFGSGRHVAQRHDERD